MDLGFSRPYTKSLLPDGLKPREIPDVAAFDSFLKLHASLDDAKSPLFTFW